MPEFPREIEIQRVINLITGFGWTKVSEELRGDDLILTIKKTFLKEEDTGEQAPPT